MMNSNNDAQVEQPRSIQTVTPFINHSIDEPSMCEVNMNRRVPDTDFDLAAARQGISSQDEAKEHNQEDGKQTVHVHKEKTFVAVDLCEQDSIALTDNLNQAEMNMIVVFKTVEQLHNESIEEVRTCLGQMSTSLVPSHENFNDELNLRMEEDSNVAEDVFVASSMEQILSYQSFNDDVEPISKQLTVDTRNMDVEQHPLKIEPKEEICSDNEEEPFSTQTFLQNATAINQAEMNMIEVFKPVEQSRNESIVEAHSCLVQMSTEPVTLNTKNNEELNLRMEVDSDHTDDPLVTNKNCMEPILSCESNADDEQTSKQLTVSGNISQEVTDLTIPPTLNLDVEQHTLRIEGKEAEKQCSTQSIRPKISVKPLNMLMEINLENKLKENGPSTNKKSQKKSVKPLPALMEINLENILEENDKNSSEVIDLTLDELDDLPILPTSLPRAVVDGFFNWTSINLPKEVEVLLSFGPKLWKKNNMSLTNTIPTCYIDNCMSVRILNPDAFILHMLSMYYSHIADLQKINNSYIQRVYLHMISVTQNFLVKYQDVRIITTANDDKCTILVYKNDYHQRMQQLLDKGIKIGVYRLYKGDFCTQYTVIKKSFDSISSLVKKYCKNSKPAHLAKRIQALFVEHEKNCVESVLPCLYGRVASHEPEFPCHAMVNTSRWLANPIKEVVALILNEIFINKSNASNSGDMNHIAKQLHNIPNCGGHEFVTYRIKDLYSIIQTQYIYSYLELFTKTNIFQSKCPLSPDLFLQCLKFSLYEGNYFYYERHVYTQFSGLPQGAPDTDILIKVYLDYLMVSLASVLFESHRINYWWMYRHEFLVYMPTYEIKNFARDFKTYAQLELITQRETICNYKPMPTIEFFNLQITRGPKQIFLNQLRSPAYYSHLDSLTGTQCTVQNSKHDIFENIRRVLKWTSTTYLLDDLKQQEMQFRNSGFPVIRIANAYNNLIKCELEKLGKNESEVKLSKKETTLRKKILNTFKSRFQSYEPKNVSKKELKRLKK